MLRMGSKRLKLSALRLLIWLYGVFRHLCVAVSLHLMVLRIVCGPRTPRSAPAQDGGRRSTFPRRNCSVRADELVASRTTIYSQRARWKCFRDGILRTAVITVGAALRGRPFHRITPTGRE